ncbi:MAG TPA: hypothetical protein VEZ11_00340 [Thermoanaerobaculia bacterium]|nr:hypothetical protein [Thermoanaerobaculia bacterium]
MRRLSTLPAWARGSDLLGFLRIDYLSMMRSGFLAGTPESCDAFAQGYRDSHAWLAERERRERFKVSRR